jgi:hypothetical protein
MHATIFQPLTGRAPFSLRYIPLMTMQRALFAIVALVLALVCGTQACAERNFPEQAKRGDLKAYEYPLMKIGDQIYRLAVGGRILNQQNRIIMPASLQVNTAPIMYMLDTSGYLSRIWLLTEDEAVQHPPPK